MIYVFGEYELDTGLYELRRAGASYKVEPKAFDLLIYLIQHRDRVVTREELFERVWSAPFISEVILSHHIMVARKAVGDDGRAQRMIKTIHGRGYRFIARVDVREQPNSDVREVDPPARTEPVSQPTSPLVQDVATQNVLAGDHALITVLCATLDNIAALSEQLGFEVLQRLRQTFFTHAQDVVQRYEGMLQFFGADGVLSVFKSGMLHADHAQRAVSAALDLQHRLRTSVTETTTQATISGSARMVLHTGPVALESLSGNTVNLAVWLSIRRGRVDSWSAPRRCSWCRIRSRASSPAPSVFQGMPSRSWPIKSIDLTSQMRVECCEHSRSANDHHIGPTGVFHCCPPRDPLVEYRRIQ